MKMKDIKSKKKGELIKEIRVAKLALKDNRFRSKADEKNTKLARETRKKIARISTHLNQKA